MKFYLNLISTPLILGNFQVLGCVLVCEIIFLTGSTVFTINFEQLDQTSNQFEVKGIYTTCIQFLKQKIFLIGTVLNLTTPHLVMNFFIVQKWVLVSCVKLDFYSTIFLQNIKYCWIFTDFLVYSPDRVFLLKNIAIFTL